MLDWELFLTRHGIDYVIGGNNQRRDEIGIRCPKCGDDPSYHCAINTKGKGWVCRRGRHGGQYTELVHILLGVTWAEAQRMVGAKAAMPDDFDAALAEKLNGAAPRDGRTKIALPSEFKPLRDLPSARPYLRHLTDVRRFDRADCMDFTKRYGIYYCTQGPFAGRIMFTAHRDKNLISYTGRTIHDDVTPRYRALSESPELAEKLGIEPAIEPITSCLLWYDRLRTTVAHTIVLTEGPMDALRVRVLGRSKGIHATCFFGPRPRDKQVGLLADILPRFKHRFLLLDKAALATSLSVHDILRPLGVERRELPPTLKDPGEIRSEQQLLQILFGRSR